ncbi:MAG: glycosyltransferase [Paludibacteraceae bacterium]|nr:glycosyltransferase [Paludibacteraceae bacterium]
MKILFVIDTYDTSNNGTSISAQRYAEELRKRGNEVKILTTGEPGDDRFALPVFKMPVFQPLMDKHDFNFAYNDTVVIQNAVEWADIIHCFLPFAVEIAAKRYADKIGKPTTAAFHIQPQNMTSSVGLGKTEWINERFYHNFRVFFYDKFRHIHCPSEFMANEIRKRGYKAKLHVISNGIEDKFIEAGHHNMEYGKPAKESQFDGKIIVMMVGRLSKEKRQDVLINAVPMSKFAEKIQLIFAGHGPEYNHYVELGKNLPNQPQFVYVSSERLIELLSQADLYVHASDMESEAISCIEAFATGLVPVIANSTESATPQFALDGRSLFMPGDPRDLARAMDYWLEHNNERAYIERLYQKEAKRYSLSNSVRMFEEMLNEAIEDQKALAE